MAPAAHRSTQPTERTTTARHAVVTATASFVRPDRAAVAAVAAGCCATGLRHVGLVGGRRCFPGDHGDHLGHGSLNVPIELHPTIRYMVYNGYYTVMSNIPKMGQLPTPVGHLEILRVIVKTCKNNSANF